MIIFLEERLKETIRFHMKSGLFGIFLDLTKDWVRQHFNKPYVHFKIYIKHKTKRKQYYQNIITNSLTIQIILVY